MGELEEGGRRTGVGRWRWRRPTAPLAAPPRRPRQLLAGALLSVHAWTGSCADADTNATARTAARNRSRAGPRSKHALCTTHQHTTHDPPPTTHYPPPPTTHHPPPTTHCTPHTTYQPHLDLYCHTSILMSECVLIKTKQIPPRSSRDKGKCVSVRAASEPASEPARRPLLPPRTSLPGVWCLATPARATPLSDTGFRHRPLSNFFTVWGF
jgi:hypothetical protein